ncbi:class I SAM-dependent methyltransferase [Candidatus Parcubacteria bacterium]|nr:class I SAM-dependent methyltransferase [Patescibacteria group bacterium]MBU4482382.1 class I SAM-dependent methyltransferase [Patescibacteria group bacterium]MCG2686960.1 class I SAM-dependent methyltransferase [Candidatus Parcubacteria bacterium]
MRNTKTAPGGNELLDANDLLKNKLGVTYGSYIADLGCGGIGFFVIKAAQIAGSDGVVYAVDILKSALANVEARARLLGLNNIKTVWSNLEKYGATKINNDYLDFALLINILFQSDDNAGIIKEAVRLLKPGGKLMVIDWQAGRFPIGPKPEDKIPPEKLTGIAESLNLTVEKQFEAGKFHYGIVFGKE